MAAGKIVKGQTRHQRVNKKLVRISLQQREKWLRIAEKAALAIKSVGENIDEKELLANLEELEALLNQTKTETNQNHQQTTSSIKSKPHAKKRRNKRFHSKSTFTQPKQN